jgi:SAM-dependent methyltransferase
MVYKVTQEEVSASQEVYRKNYKPWRPFQVTPAMHAAISKRFANLVVTQNGQDTDDYIVPDNSRLERYLKQHPAGTKALILGVGTGREVSLAKSMGFQAVGTTLGSRNTDYAHDYLGLGEQEVLECLNEVLPFSPGTFDVVAGLQIFEHAMAPLLFLLEQRRVLRLGGRLVLEWPPALNYSSGDNPHHQVCYVPGQAYALFQKAGFEGIKVYYDDMSPIPEDMWWRGDGDQSKMLVIEGVKGDCSDMAYKEHVLRSERL